MAVPDAAKDRVLPGAAELALTHEGWFQRLAQAAAQAQPTKEESPRDALPSVGKPLATQDKPRPTTLDEAKIPPTENPFSLQPPPADSSLVAPVPEMPTKEECQNSIAKEECQNSIAKEVRRKGYPTNDLVMLIGGLIGNVRRLKINGLRSFSLNRKEFILFYILACHWLTFHGLPAPRRVNGGRYLSSGEIIAELELMKRENRALAGFWTNAEYEQVPAVKLSLRKKIIDANGNKLLILTGPGPVKGYCLNTRPENVTFALSDADSFTDESEADL